MKISTRAGLACLCAAMALSVAACAGMVGDSTTSPAQKAVNATALVCKDNDAAIVAADQAVLAGVLKGQDARNAVKGLTAIQTGCVATLAAMQAAQTAATPAASGAKP